MGDVHNAILYETGLLNALAIFAGLSRDQGGVERLGETLTPIVDPYARPEVSFLRGEMLVAAATNQSAVAAEFSCVGLLVPAANPNILAVIERAHAEMSTGTNTIQLRSMTEAQVNALTGATTIPTAGVPRDSRWQARAIGNLVGRATIFRGTAAAITGRSQWDFPTGPAGTTFPYEGPFPVVLHPGFAIGFWATTANINLNAALAWRERQALPGELLG